jgi:hypothetical protein
MKIYIVRRTVDYGDGQDTVLDLRPFYLSKKSAGQRIEQEKKIFAGSVFRPRHEIIAEEVEP